MNTYVCLVNSPSKKLNNTRVRVNGTDSDHAMRKLKHSLRYDFPSITKVTISDPIELDSTRLPDKDNVAYGFPARNHTGYYAVTDGNVVGAYVHYETARANGSIVVIRQYAISLYGYQEKIAA